MSPVFSEDGFLGGRLIIAQPRAGFRAGHDAVLLAAAVPAKAGERMLELGSGSGVASLCLAARIADVSVLGVEIDAELVRLANENAARNSMGGRVRFNQGDAENLELEDELFDHVFFNPPFHPDTGQVSQLAARDKAMRDRSDAVAGWTRTALAATRNGGTVTAIVRADREHEILDVVEVRGATIFPLFPRVGEVSKRVIVQIVKRGAEPVRRASGLVLHLPDGKPTAEADAVLRHAAPIAFA